MSRPYRDYIIQEHVPAHGERIQIEAHRSRAALTVPAIHQHSAAEWQGKDIAVEGEIEKLGQIINARVFGRCTRVDLIFTGEVLCEFTFAPAGLADMSPPDTNKIKALVDRGYPD